MFGYKEKLWRLKEDQLALDDRVRMLEDPKYKERKRIDWLIRVTNPYALDMYTITDLHCRATRCKEIADYYNKLAKEWGYRDMGAEKCKAEIPSVPPSGIAKWPNFVDTPADNKSCKFKGHDCSECEYLNKCLDEERGSSLG